METRKSGPSDEAIHAGAMTEWDGAKAVLDAAHDPALGEARSVCLRDVLDALRYDLSLGPEWDEAMESRWWTFSDEANE